MPLLHDASVRRSIETRLGALEPTLKPKWGRMSVDQMLWHVNEAMMVALGQKSVPAQRFPLPKPVIKFVTLSLPWIKNAPTNAGCVARAQHDFDLERARCLMLIDAVVSRRMEGHWVNHPIFG